MHVQEVEEVDEIGIGQKKSRDVVCWQCGEKGYLQCDCPHKGTDEQIESMDDPNAYAGRSEQVIRINQPITVATRDNIYKQMGSQRTKANIYKAGYRKTRAALQEQQKINAAITSTLAAQASQAPTQINTNPTRVIQTRVAQTPNVQQAVAQTPVVQQQSVQTSVQPTQTVQLPATPGSSVPTNVQTPQGNVRYIRLPPGATRGTYNLRSVPLNNSLVVKTTTTVVKGKANLQNTHVKQEPITPGTPSTPKAKTPTTTVVRKEKVGGNKLPL